MRTLLINESYTPRATGYYIYFTVRVSRPVLSLHTFSTCYTTIINTGYTPYNTIRTAWVREVVEPGLWHPPTSRTASHLTRERVQRTEGEARLVQRAHLAWNVRSGLARPAATRASARAWSSWIGPRASRAGVAAPAAHGSPATARCGRRPASCPPRAGSASACASARKSAAATGPAPHARGQGG